MAKYSSHQFSVMTHGELRKTWGGGVSYFQNLHGVFCPPYNIGRGVSTYTVIYPVSNLIQFRIKWSYRHELHNSCSIKKQIFCMVIKSIFFSSSARSHILKTYLHAKNKSVLRDDLSN